LGFKTGKTLQDRHRNRRLVDTFFRIGEDAHANAALEGVDDGFLDDCVGDKVCIFNVNCLCGAEVYTKKVYGDSTTLHSKLLIVDGVFSWIGSHNFHPRSDRYEREVVLASFDENLARQCTEIFDKDIAADKANQPTLDELTASKSSWLNKYISTHFFDQL
jgi:phosphatidylserine/phosphatidylglycerophosphate/cardiolipin synthase-like enzyme